MDPELVKLLLDTGLPSGLLMVVIAMQWRRRTTSARNLEDGRGTMYYQLENLQREIRRMADDDSDYHKAHEVASRERHKEVLIAIRGKRSA
jgi:hypothetical protein